jgi:hypothetical protein
LAYLDTTDKGEKDSKTLLIPSIDGSTSSAKVLTSLLRILRSTHRVRVENLSVLKADGVVEEQE